MSVWNWVECGEGDCVEWVGFFGLKRRGSCEEKREAASVVRDGRGLKGVG